MHVIQGVWKKIKPFEDYLEKDHVFPIIYLNIAH